MNKDNRIFYYSILISLCIHVVVITVLSIKRAQTLVTKTKQMEVTYQDIKTKHSSNKESAFKDVKLVKEMPKPQTVKALSKEFGSSTMMQEKFHDLTKPANTFQSSKVAVPTIAGLDKERKITIPLLKSEKISSPQYLSYNDSIRQRIRQRAYAYVESEEFQSGEVYLTFALGSDGSLKDIKVIEQKTRASQFLKDLGIRSIREAAPFPAFPKDLNYPELTFNVVISFEVGE